MLLTEAHGIPISARIAAVHTIETLVDLRVTTRRPKRLIYDKAADADWIRDSLSWRGIELITLHRKGRKKPPREDGRSLRRYLIAGKPNEQSAGFNTEDDSLSDTNDTLISSKVSFIPAA